MHAFKFGSATYLRWLRRSAIAVAAAAMSAMPCAAQLEFGPPDSIDEINVPSTGEFSPSLSADGLELYFMGYERSGGFGDSDLWVARRSSVAEPFLPPANLGKAINSGSSESNPELSFDGLTLYFDSARPGGFGDRDLWMTTRTGLNEAWGAPVNLGPGVNTSGWEGRPTVTADGLSIAFDRDHERHLNTLQMATRDSIAASFSSRTDLGIAASGAGFSPDGLLLLYPGFINGQVDLFFSARASADGVFGPGQHLDSPINSPLYTEIDPGFSYDGTQLYFVRTTLDIFGDRFLTDANIYVATAVPEPSSVALAITAFMGLLACSLRSRNGRPAM